MTIYIATDGEYSEYHICTVFTDKDQAMIYCATHECMLEEYEADEVKLETTKSVKEKWLAEFDCYGVFLFAEKRGLCFDKPISIVRKSSRVFMRACFPIGTDEGMAEKIFCDMYAKWKEQETQNLLKQERRF